MATMRLVGCLMLAAAAATTTTSTTTSIWSAPVSHLITLGGGTATLDGATIGIAAGATSRWGG